MKEHLHYKIVRETPKCSPFKPNKHPHVTGSMINITGHVAPLTIIFIKKSEPKYKK